MNKKGAEGLSIKVIVEIILLLIVLLIALNFYGSNIINLAKTTLGLTDEVLELNYTAINQRARVNLDTLLEDIENCKASKNNSCGCETTFYGFFKTHLLSINENQIQLLNIKNINNLKDIKEGKVNPITIDQKEFSNLNCYFDNSFRKEELTPMFISFDEEGAFIWEDKFFKDKKYRFTHNLQLYKTDKAVCWLTNKVREDKVQNINECK